MYDKQYLIVMVGLPGSGKSTLAAELADRFNAEVVSTDSLREQITGREGDISQDSVVFPMAYKKCRDALLSRKSVIFDACNISVGARRAVLNCAQNIRGIEKVAVIMSANVEECAIRDAQRNRNVGFTTILSYAEDYVRPKMSEGFTQIALQRANGEIYID